ncbi:hypothetical protein BDF14DRAFT_1774328 [Spinellus fusiger]|nr:hypothetical protein BDF14DRAFT_1774328 [Spinellus fusiger]
MRLPTDSFLFYLKSAFFFSFLLLFSYPYLLSRGLFMKREKQINKKEAGKKKEIFAFYPTRHCCFDNPHPTPVANSISILNENIYKMQPTDK